MALKPRTHPVQPSRRDGMESGHPEPWVETHGYIRVSRCDRMWWHGVPWVEIHGYIRSSRCDGKIVVTGVPWVETHGYIRVSRCDRM